MVFLMDDPQGHILSTQDLENLKGVEGNVLIHTEAIVKFVQAGLYSIYPHGQSGRIGNLLPGSKFEVDVLSDFVGFLMDLALVNELWIVVEAKLHSIRQQCGHIMQTYDARKRR
jgi:hypothetical protein